MDGYVASSHDQKDDLERQKQVIELYCAKQGWTFEVVADTSSVREWTCPACGAIHDRDVNAAINLENLAVSFTVSACGEEGSGLGRKLKTKPASVKQESNSKATYGWFCIGMDERWTMVNRHAWPPEPPWR